MVIDFGVQSSSLKSFNVFAVISIYAHACTPLPVPFM